jgi:SAM-dependent methyltransferase
MQSNTSAKTENVTLDTIRRFYEGHPYPRPIDNLDKFQEEWADPNRRRVEFHRFWFDRPFRENLTILVAGCGTSQAAKYALRWPEARVVGIDLSAKSVEHTQKLKNKYSLSNLEVHQMPIEQAATLNRKFDLIVSTGVLHHLPDPVVGLMALGNCLAPGGCMHLMVYAPYGRTGIYMLQDYCRRLKIGSSSGEIHDLAASLHALPPDHPIVPLLSKSPDFQNEAGLADALLNPQDRSYTVEQFIELIETSGLQFDRWVRQAPYLPYCGTVTRVPHAALLGRLLEREQFAAMELLRGNMLRHSAIVSSATDQLRMRSVRFENDIWLDYVPIRLPETITVEEKLPPNAAAVLINRAHTHTDIYMSITTLQKKIVDRIDGVRTIREIVDKDASQADARALVQQLWRHDQVVFDASQAGNNGAEEK